MKLWSFHKMLSLCLFLLAFIWGSCQTVSAQYYYGNGMGSVLNMALRTLTRATMQVQQQHLQQQQQKQEAKLAKQQAKEQAKQMKREAKQMKLQAKLQQKQMKLQAKLQRKQMEAQAKNPTMNPQQAGQPYRVYESAGPNNAPQ